MPIPKGILVGFMEDINYKTARLYLKPGDTLFVYSDGVTEAENRQKVLFSDDKLIKLLATSSGINAQKMVELVENEINAFTEGADQSDDITMLAVRYLK
jgi:sigma-B regulation protein RsbU (phosphoserine phosphatase)